MSIDFDSAALQTQHEDEEFDQEDYAREQELHKLLIDLPDDMLEDSIDSSSPELEYSSNKNTGNSPQSTWSKQWSNHPKQASHKQDNEADFHPDSQEYIDDEDVQINGRLNNPEIQPALPTWNLQSQGHQFIQGDYGTSNTGAEKSPENNDFSTDETYESRHYPRGAPTYNGAGECRANYDYNNPSNNFQNSQSGSGDRGVDKYKANYNPHHPPHQMFHSQATQQENQFSHLQRQFLDSTQQSAEKEQLVQLQILKKAQQRQIEDLEQKLEDSRRNMRYLEHQIAIVKDEKDGLAVRFKESNQQVEEAKEREIKMQKKLKAMEQQIQVLNERDQENTKKQRLAVAAVDSMKQQMLELCRSDTLSRAREQHDRDLAIIGERHESALLAIQEKLDSTSNALSEQNDVGRRLQEQVKQLERQREEEQLERARVINTLTQRLEESQQQCANLLQTGSVQDMSQMQIKLKQAQSAKALSENMNKVLQEDLEDLKKQINLYESAVKHGVIILDMSGDLESQLSESFMDLGLKKTTVKNYNLHRTALTNLSDGKLSKDEALQQLRVEMQRCLGILKGKRQKVTHLQEELQQCQASLNELQTQLDEARLRHSIGESLQNKHQDPARESHREFMGLQKDKQQLQDQVAILENKLMELRQNEEKLRSANLDLCTKMRQMIKELDQEKQESAERSERIHQQHREDLVKRVKTELMLEHNAQVEQLSAQHQLNIQQLQIQLSETNDKMLAVQECYISVCKEKDALEEGIRKREIDDPLMRDNEQKMNEERIEKLRSEMEAQHQASINQLKSLWSKEKETKVQQQVNSHIALAKAAWNKELQQMEKAWTQKLEEASSTKYPETAEGVTQTDEIEASGTTVTVEEMESRLVVQKELLQMESDKVKHKAVEEARKQAQRETLEKHLKDMAKQIEGAVTRAYNRWVEDLTSLPEYQASLQSEKKKWEMLQGKCTEQQVNRALKEAEEQWLKRHKSHPEELKIEELQEKVESLQSQLEQTRREQDALMKAELAGARAAWNKEKQQTISSIQVQSEQVYQTTLQEQHKKMKEALQQVKEDAELEKRELLLQVEARLQQAVNKREEEIRCQTEEEEQARRQQMKDEFLDELQTGLCDIQAELLRNQKTDQHDAEDTKRTSRAVSQGAITHMVRMSCKVLVNGAVSQAKREWKRISEERLTHILKETQQRHESEINKIQNSVQKKEQTSCRKECRETLSSLQKKNQKLQQHLEKTCCQLQQSVREHKIALQSLKDEHGSTLRKTQEEHLQQLKDLKRTTESSSTSEHQQTLQQGLEEMKRQYLTTIDKIRGDMLQYLQESRGRAAEIIRIEVQRERQGTARKMRSYYLTCLQELLDDGGQMTGAEKKIMNAASKLAAMAKVLETPVKQKPGNHYSLPSRLTAEAVGFSKEPLTLSDPADIKPGERIPRGNTDGDNDQKTTSNVRNKVSRNNSASVIAEGGAESQDVAHTHFHSYKPSQRAASFAYMSQSRELYLQGSDSAMADRQRKPTQETPVRDVNQVDWSTGSSDSDMRSHVSRLSSSGRKIEPVKPFSVVAASISDLGEFGSLNPNASDLTAYNEIPSKTPQSQTFSTVKMGSHGGATPHPEGMEPGDFLRPLFSELRLSQQDSGFDSPFYQPK